MPALHAIDEATFRVQPWANGQGQTTQLAAGPQPAAWQWRISIAAVQADGPFSVLPGVRRQLAPLDGRMELHFADGQIQVARRGQVLHFDGGRSLRSRLPDGPGRDINLMLRGQAEGELLVRPLLDSMVLPPAPDQRWFVLALNGMLRLGSTAETLTLHSGQAAWATPRQERVLLEGSGELALVRLQQGLDTPDR